jgi:two-component system, OmpR family, sensor histidine kinase KdpD
MPRMVSMRNRVGWRVWRGYLPGALGIALVTIVAEPNRDRLNSVTIALSYLVIVLASATLGGLGPGIFVSVVGFLTFNFFFLPPYDTFIVGAPQDIVALFVFLIVAGVTSELVSRLREREQEARRRAIESETLSRLSTELIADVTLDTALTTVVEQVTRVFDLESAAVLLPDQTGTLHVRLAYPAAAAGLYVRDREHAAVAAHVFTTGVPAGVGSPHRVYRPHGPENQGGAMQPRGRRVLYVPVRAARGAVGVMGVAAVRAGDYSGDERRMLTTFANQAALAIDRARLIEEATRAAALEEADRLKSALLAAVSHDLRTPLASIKASATSLLQEDIAWDAATRRELLTAIDEETDRLTRLVGNLLDLTRIQGGALKPEKEWNEIGEVIASVTDRLAPLTRTHPLRVMIAPDLPPVAFDFVEIAQVLANLIENAAQYSDSASEIAVTAERDGASLRVRVADHGFGIPPEDVPHVFDTFYRVRREGRAGRIGGTGIGLAICKGFVEAHGGAIAVASVVGQGSTFTFTLPITPAPAAPAPAALVAGVPTR